MSNVRDPDGILLFQMTAIAGWHPGAAGRAKKPIEFISPYSQVSRYRGDEYYDHTR
jgi:hypothetical protein